MTSLVSLGDPGLDRVLGGGLPLLDRGAGRENTIVLVRGPSGAGKSLLAAKIATALSKHTNAVALWACVELLTVEATTQLASLEGHAPAFDSVLSSPDELPAAPAIFAEQVRMDAPEPTNIASQCDELLDRCAERGFAPSVIIVDSIATGYRFTEAESRLAADALCKSAHARGLSLVIVEESDLSSQSIWTYAVDVVIELDRRPKVRPDGSSFARECVIAKNRFGFANVGPHQLQLSKQGVNVFPRPGSYARATTARSHEPVVVRYNAPDIGLETYPNVNGRLSSLVGPDERVGIKRAHSIIGSVVNALPTSRVLAIDLASERPRFDLSRILGDKVLSAAIGSLGLGNPSRTPHDLLATLERARSEFEPSLVFISDLSDLDRFSSPVEHRHALAIWCAVLRDEGITVVAHEAAMLDDIVGLAGGGRAFRSAAYSPSLVHRMADLQFEHRVIPTDQAFEETIFEPSTARRWKLS